MTLLNIFIMKVRRSFCLLIHLLFGYKYFSRFIASVYLLYLLSFCNTSLSAQQISPSEWQFESQRKEIAPICYIDNKVTFSGIPTVALAGGGKEFADGHWYSVVKVEPGAWFQFQAYFLASKVEEPNRCVLARILWQDASGQNVGSIEYPVTLLDKTKEGWSIIEQTYKVPVEAKKAKIELQY